MIRPDRAWKYGQPVPGSSCTFDGFRVTTAGGAAVPGRSSATTTTTTQRTRRWRTNVLQPPGRLWPPQGFPYSHLLSNCAHTHGWVCGESRQSTLFVTPGVRTARGRGKPPASDVNKVSRNNARPGSVNHDSAVRTPVAGRFVRRQSGVRIGRLKICPDEGKRRLAEIIIYVRIEIW